MVLGLGVDLIRMDRMAAAISGDPTFYEAFCSATESQELRGLGLTAKNLAVLFAAKEAALKALDIELAGTSLIDVNVSLHESGRIELRFEGELAKRAAEAGVRGTSAAASFTKEYAVAVVVLET